MYMLSTDYVLSTQNVIAFKLLYVENITKLVMKPTNNDIYLKKDLIYTNLLHQISLK